MRGTAPRERSIEDAKAIPARFQRKPSNVKIGLNLCRERDYCRRPLWISGRNGPSIMSYAVAARKAFDRTVDVESLILRIEPTQLREFPFESPL